MAVCAAYGIPHSQFLDWDPDDREKAIWWNVHQTQTCSGCGTRAEEWDETQGGDRHAYVPKKVRCRGCEARERAEASINPKKDGRGMRIVLRARQPDDQVVPMNKPQQPRGGLAGDG